MLGLVELHLIGFASAFLLSIGIGWWTLQNKDKQAAEILVVLAVITAGWNLTILIAIPISNPQILRTLYYVSNIFIASVTFSWFYFGLSYAGYNHILGRRPVKILLIGVGSFMVLTLSLPPFTTFTYSEFAIAYEPFALVYDPNNSLMTSINRWIGILFAGVGSFAVVYRVVDAGYARSWQVFAIIGTTLFSLLFEVMGERVVPYDHISYSSLYVTMSLFIYVIALYRYDLFGYTPVVKDDIIESVSDPVLAINPDDRIVNYNDAARHVISDEISFGSDSKVVLPEELYEAYNVHDIDIYSDGPIELKKNGQSRHYDINMAPLEGVSGQQGIALTLRDITDLRARTKDLERQTKQLNNFASIVSHDLRNPLQVATGYAQQLLAEQENGHAENIVDALDRMNTIIEDALLMAREGSALENPESQRLEPIIESAWDMAKREDASLNNQIPPEYEITTDGQRLQTLFENLFRNSMDHGGPAVTVTVKLREHGNGFIVADDGPGIGDEMKEKVLEQGVSTSDSGTGFGLAIVESISQAHGWEVEITGSESGGARFDFVFNSD